MKKSRPWACKTFFQRAGLALVLTVLLSLAPGCAGRRPAGPVFDPAADAAAGRLALGLYERGRDLTSFAARGRANYFQDSRRHFFRFEVISKKPGRLLFTAFDPAGRPAFKLAVDQGRLAGALYGQRQYIVGPATAENLRRFIPVDLSPDELLALMTGAQVEPGRVQGRGLSAGTESELVVTPAAAGDAAAVWRLRLAGPLDQNPAKAAVASAAFGPAGRPTTTIAYSGVTAVAREDLPGSPDEPFPHRVTAQWAGAERRSLELDYDEVRLGAAIPDALFVLERPNGFESVNLP